MLPRSYYPVRHICTNVPQLKEQFRNVYVGRSGLLLRDNYGWLCAHNTLSPYHWYFHLTYFSALCLPLPRNPCSPLPFSRPHLLTSFMSFLLLIVTFSFISSTIYFLSHLAKGWGRAFALNSFELKFGTNMTRKNQNLEMTQLAPCLLYSKKKNFSRFFASYNSDLREILAATPSSIFFLSIK